MAIPRASGPGLPANDRSLSTFTRSTVFAKKKTIVAQINFRPLFITAGRAPKIETPNKMAKAINSYA